jgi:hypothetical protein
MPRIKKARYRVSSWLLKTISFHSRCRHGVFAKHFGDDPPKCERQCDVCKEPKALQQRFDVFCAHETENIRSRIKHISSVEDDGDLYEGGRAGTKKSVSWNTDLIPLFLQEQRNNEAARFLYYCDVGDFVSSAHFVTILIFIFHLSCVVHFGCS